MGSHLEPLVLARDSSPQQATVIQTLSLYTRPLTIITSPKPGHQGPKEPLHTFLPDGPLLLTIQQC